MQKLEDERDPEMAALIKAREEEIWRNNIYEIRGDIGKLQQYERRERIKEQIKKEREAKARALAEEKSEKPSMSYRRGQTGRSGGGFNWEALSKIDGSNADFEGS